MKSEAFIVQDRLYLRFEPPGYGHVLELPVIQTGSRKKSNAWTWNGSLDNPTLKPSIRTVHGQDGQISHFWLNDGICKFLNDSTDGNAGKEIPLIDLKEGKE